MVRSPERIDFPVACSYFVLMSISTLGDAVDAGWRVFASCCQCPRREELQTETLLWRSGRAMPLTLLAERLRCPKCGCRDVRVTYDVPTTPIPTDEDPERYKIEQLDLRGVVVETLTRDRFTAGVECFDDLVRRKPGCRFLMRDGSRMVRVWPTKSPARKPDVRGS